MRRSEPTILTGWWDFAVRAFALLTTPHADVERCDQDVEALARTSVIGRALHAISFGIRRAWIGSRARVLVRWLESTMMPEPGTGAWRVGGWMMAVAGATTLVLGPLTTMDEGPLVWVIPAVLVVAGVLAMALAAPLARAVADRRSSHSHEA